MKISTRTLVQIAGWGGIVVATTGFYLQYKIIDRIRSHDYYKLALQKLRTHAGAVYFLGEPIKDRRFKLSDTESNASNGQIAHFRIPVVGQKDKGIYWFWAEKREDQWCITKAQLQLKSKPDEILVIVKE